MKLLIFLLLSVSVSAQTKDEILKAMKDKKHTIQTKSSDTTRTATASKVYKQQVYIAPGVSATMTGSTITLFTRTKGQRQKLTAL